MVLKFIDVLILVIIIVSILIVGIIITDARIMGIICVAIFALCPLDQASMPALLVLHFKTRALECPLTYLCKSLQRLVLM